MTRVTVLSSLPAVRAGIERLLEGDAELEVSVQAGDPSGTAKLREGKAAVVVISQEPLWRSIVAEIAAGGEGRPAPVLVTDEAADCRFLASRLAEGDAWGALPLAASPEELRRAVGAVAQGLVVVHPSLLPPLLGGGAGAADPDPLLTEREREVLDLLSRGFSNSQIAGFLGISEHTVKFHTSSVYGKLGVANRTEAVRAGIRSGAIHL